MKFLLLLVLLACGDSKTISTRTQENEVDILRQEVLRLQGTADQLNDLVNSDFATCPASGDTADALIRKICTVAQASTAEQRVEFKGQINQFVSILDQKLDATNEQIILIDADVQSLSATVSSINSSISTLQSEMTTANNAIVTLQNQIASISGTLNGTMQIVDIGAENIAAGPVYESVLRRSDKTRINAYVDVYSSWKDLSSNSLFATNGSANVTITKPVSTVTISNASPGLVTLTSHGFANQDPVMFATTGSLPTGLSPNTLYFVRNKTANTFNVSLTPTSALINTSSAGSGVHTSSIGLVAGDVVVLSGASSGRGLARGDLQNEFVVNAGATTSSLSITLNRLATSTGTFGGSSASIKRVAGRGIATVWVTANGADSVVRTTTLGSRWYNFIVKANGDVCYSTVVPLEIFATIDAGGGNIICK